MRCNEHNLKVFKAHLSSAPPIWTFNILIRVYDDSMSSVPRGKQWPERCPASRCSQGSVVRSSVTYTKIFV